MDHFVLHSKYQTTSDQPQRAFAGEEEKAGLSNEADVVNRIRELRRESAVK